MGLGERIKRLELVRGGKCPACGLGSSSTGEYGVVWNEDPEPAEPERCSECGWQLEYIVTWDDLWHAREYNPLTKATGL